MKQLIILYSILLMSSLIFGLSSKAISSPNLEIIYWIINLILIIKFAKLTWNISRHSFEINEIKSTVALEIVLLSIISFFFLSLYFTTLEKLGVPKIGITGSYLNSGWPLWSVFVMSAILPGFFEEIIFRGIIQPNLAKLTSEKEALIVQAALFSVLHLLPIIFVSHFVMGLLAGWVRLRLGHIYYGIFLHVLWNSYVIYLEFNNM